MRARLLADADLRVSIVYGLRRIEPTVDFLTASPIIPPKYPDPAVLALAANLERVVVSHDYETMPAHFYEFLRTRESAGLVLIAQECPIGLAIERLHIAWFCNDAEAFRNRVTYL